MRKFDAKWWQFWHPGSGIAGGILGGAILCAVILLCSSLSK
ncbi:hypothetical protein JXVLWARM_CDS_0112 [Burkholderia phage Bm1]